MNDCEQLGSALVIATPVTCSVCPLFAAVKPMVLKLAAPPALTETFVTVCTGPPLMVYVTVMILLATRPVKFICAG